VDSRLFKIETRPGNLRRQDLPILARALVAVLLRQGRAKTGTSRNLQYVRLETPEGNVQVLASDWAKIMPYLQDDSFNQTVFKSQMDTVWLDPLTAHAPSIIDRTDRQYYLRVLNTLQGLFPVEYPTSSL